MVKISIFKKYLPKYFKYTNKYKAEIIKDKMNKLDKKVS